VARQQEILGSAGTTAENAIRGPSLAFYSSIHEHILKRTRNRFGTAV
jgi:hypothetical protein